MENSEKSKSQLLEEAVVRDPKRDHSHKSYTQLLEEAITSNE